MDLHGCSLLAIEGPSVAEFQLEPASHDQGPDGRHPGHGE